jgi:hypothetical protein
MPSPAHTRCRWKPWHWPGFHQPAVTSIILGVTRVEQLEANLACTEVDLSAEELAQLGKASALPMEYPGWMIANGSTERQALLDNGLRPRQEG